MYQFSLNFFQLECYMLWWLWLARFFFILSRSLKVHESWCSTTSWTGRRTWRRRQRSSLTLQCITSVGLFILVDIKLVYTFDVNHHHHCISHPSWRKFQPIVSDLPGLLPALMWSDMLKVHVKNFHINQHQQTISRPGWGQFQLMWYIVMSVTSLVFSSRFSSLSTVSSTTNSHVLNVWSDMLKLLKTLIPTTITK